MTLNNLQGVDSFTRNHWRSRSVFRIDVGPPVKQRIGAVFVFPSLQVEHVEETLGEHSPLLTPICSSNHTHANANAPRAVLLAFTHLAPTHRSPGRR